MVGITLAEVGITLEARDGEAVTDTLLRAGYMMRMACRRGGCGLCRVHVDEGSTVYRATVAESVLPTSEREEGIVLACRAVPTCDVSITVPVASKLRCVTPLITPYALRKQPQPGGRDVSTKEVASG